MKLKLNKEKNKIWRKKLKVGFNGLLFEFKF